jgi:hypothetical protein
MDYEIVTDTPRASARFRELAAAGAWLLVLTLAWGQTRLLCAVAELPYDCHEIDVADALLDVSDLLEKGIVIAALTRLPYSIQKLSRRALLGGAVATLASGAIFSALGELPFMHHAISTDLTWNTAAALYIVIGVVLVIVIGIHVQQIVHHNTKADLIFFAATRVGMLVFYVAFLGTIAHSGRLHLHHYYIGLWVALIGYDSRPISMALISVGAGIMAQGIGAYGWAKLTY